MTRSSLQLRRAVFSTIFAGSPSIVSGDSVGNGIGDCSVACVPEQVAGLSGEWRNESKMRRRQKRRLHPGVLTFTSEYLFSIDWLATFFFRKMVAI